MWWVPTGGVFARSSPSVHSDYQTVSINTGPVPLEQSPHTEPGTGVPETHFPLSQMEQTSHMRLQVSEEETCCSWNAYAIIHLYSTPMYAAGMDKLSLSVKPVSFSCLKLHVLTFGACWILGFCRNRVISAFSALSRCEQTQIHKDYSVIWPFKNLQQAIAAST